MLQAFEPAFSGRTWSNVHLLIIGTLLAHGRCTVAAARRQLKQVLKEAQAIWQRVRMPWYDG
jgi:hypothetical protein